MGLVGAEKKMLRQHGMIKRRRGNGAYTSPDHPLALIPGAKVAKWLLKM